jgi:hypothetical protein
MLPTELYSGLYYKVIPPRYDFFEQLGLPCHHLFFILQHGPILVDCTTRWCHDYFGRQFTGNKEYDTAFQIAKKQGMSGPFYEPSPGECPTCYAIFSPGSMEDTHFYEEPMECTLDAIEGSSILYQLFRNKKVLPLSKLPSEIQLTQLTQELLDADHEEADDGQSFIEDTQAYHLIYPKFRQILSVSDGNSQMLGMAIKAM